VETCQTLAGEVSFPMYVLLSNQSLPYDFLKVCSVKLITKTPNTSHISLLPDRYKSHYFLTNLLVQ
jgi:hypothetical protein